MRRLDAGILVIAAVFAIALALSIRLFRGNVDEWGASLESYTQEVRTLAESLRKTAVSGMRENPDGFYKLDMGGKPVVRYYLYWRIWSDVEELPSHLQDALGSVLAQTDVDAVAEAASATVHLYSWEHRDGQLLSRWFERREVEGIEVDLFVYFGGETGVWRGAGSLDDGVAARSLGPADVEAVRNGRFNRIIVTRPGEGH